MVGSVNKVFCLFLLVGFFLGLRALLIISNFLTGENSIYPFTHSRALFFSSSQKTVWVPSLALLVIRVTS